MKFDTPATANPTDRMKVLGQPIDRIDGKLKTTGTAHYAYERNDAAPNAAYGYILGAAIAKGRIESIDDADAKAAPGVLAVVTYQNAGKLGKAKNHTARMLAGPEVQHYDQAVAVVVAETFEQARAATKLLRVNYARTNGNFDLAASQGSATKPKSGTPDTAVGDFAGAFAKSAVKVDERYTTPDQSHQMMEPHSTTAAWKDGKLTLWTSNQMINWAVGDMSETLLLPKENIHVMSPYVGGGFGSKLWVRSDAVMAALGSRAIGGRPVKLALARPQVMNNTTHRPATIQRLRIGAQKDGKITAIAHESWSGDLPGGGPETAPNATRLLYAGANRMTATRLAVLDLPEGNAMRAPGEAVGLLALEAAMDELAEKLKMDPVQLRIINDTQVDPEKPSRQFSQRDLVGCLKTGAERFGWDKRNPVPGQVRDGRWLVGMGMASAFRDNVTMKSGARVGIDKKGVVTVATDMTDIGTGSYTIIAQTAAELMGVPVDKVIVLLGDSSFPASSGSGGQWGGNSSTAGVYAACMALRDSVARKLGFNSSDVVFEDGKVKSGNRSVSLSEAAGDAGYDRVRRSHQDLCAGDVRRTLRRGWRRLGHRRNPRSPDGRRFRGGSYPQSEIGTQPGHRRDDHGCRCCPDGGCGCRQALRLFREPRSRRISRASARRRSAPGRVLHGRTRREVLADEGQGYRRTRPVWCRRRDRQRGLQCVRRPRPRIPADARQGHR